MEFHIPELTKKEILQLKKINNLEERLTSILEIDFSKNSNQNIFDIIRKKIGYFPFQTSVTRPHKIDLFPIYRVRLNINEEKENLFLLRTFSYPNPIFCRYNGRANLKNFPVFYCSDDPVTAFRECRPKIGDYAYLSEWMIRCSRPCNYMFFFPFNLKNNNNWIHMSQRQYAMAINVLKKEFGTELADKVIFIMDFIANIFTKEKEPYNISSKLVHSYIYDRGYDFIIYPSYQNNEVSCNFAFNPNFVEDFFKIDKVSKFRVAELPQGEAQIEIQAVAEYTNNFLGWRKPIKEDLPFFPEL